MATPVKVALAGLSGYGEEYLGELLRDDPTGKYVFSAAVDPFAEKSKFLEKIRDKKIPVYRNLDEMYSKFRPDLLILSTPIHLHARQSCQGLAMGSNVLCEKPVAGSLADALMMQEAESKAGGLFLAIGYQLGFSRATEELKMDIISGCFGRPIRFKTIMASPRNRAYYKRNSWAGSIRNADGHAVNDSPVNNANAHYLFNSFYLLGKEPSSAAMPEMVQAELYRSISIENYDTAALRCIAKGVEILFYTTHSTDLPLGPIHHYEFENAQIAFDRQSAQFIARFKDGSTKDYGSPDNSCRSKIESCVNSILTGAPVPCTVGAAITQTFCMEAAPKSMPVIADVPQKYLSSTGEGDGMQVAIKGITETFVRCFAMNVLPSEAGAIPWSQKGVLVQIPFV